MDHDDIMYISGFKFAADSVNNWPALVKTDIKVAREQFAVSMGNANAWSRGRIDGFLSAYGY